MNQVAQKREELYGPNRTLGLEAAKKLHREDHVKLNILKGAGIDQYDSRDTFSSVSSESFRAHTGGRVKQSSWDPSAQYATHLQLGSDQSAHKQSSVLKTDYGPKPVTQYKQHLPSGIHLANIPDMAARYQDNRGVGQSLYYADFDGDKSYKMWSSRMAKDGKKVGRRQKTTLFQKSTHFELGSDPPNLESETNTSFSACPPPVSEATTQMSAGKGKSSVFRAEDIVTSSSEEKERFLSIQKKDFTSLPPAGVSTTTSVGYSHVLPKDSSPGALSSLRRLLIEKNVKECQNPRDPSAVNVTKAFLKYDTDRSGSIELDELRAVCMQLGTPITEAEISDLLRECSQTGDGKLDYIEFIKFLTSYTPPQEDVGISTSADSYSCRTQNAGSEEEFTGGKYQTSTHFHFGNEFDPSASVYTEDFSSEEVKTSRKPQPGPHPPSSKVMHEFPVIVSGDTTSRRDFVQHDISSREEERLAMLRTNKERHSQLAVELKTGRQDKISSVMTLSYTGPPDGAKPSTPVDSIPKNFRHLESNRALPHPPTESNRSEAQENFTTPLAGPEECMTRRTLALDERWTRISDSKNTHFVLGFDQPVTLSEKMGQFSDKFPLNPNIPAAGKPNLPTKAYSVIEHSVEGLNDSTASVDKLQGVLQQRNYLKNINPRDPLNVNLRKAFLEYDKNLSGTISREEIKLVCKEMGIGVEEEELDSIVASCDKSGTGQVDYHDFALSLSRHQPPGSDQPTITTTTRKDFKHPDAQKMSDMQQLLLQLDGKEHEPLLSTHFFHTDSRDNYLLSTTRKDFTKPEEK